MQMMKMNVDINRLLEEYKPSANIFDDDSDEIRILKECIMNLPPADRIIFLLYTELGSLREVGKKIGVSHTIVYKQIKQIRLSMWEWVCEHYPNNKELIRRFETDGVY